MDPVPDPLLLRKSMYHTIHLKNLTLCLHGVLYAGYSSAVRSGCFANSIYSVCVCVCGGEGTAVSL